MKVRNGIERHIASLLKGNGREVGIEDKDNL
jgi:hypothetical protein